MERRFSAVPARFLRAEEEGYMRRALALAQQAAAQGEVPVGAVVVSAAGEVIGEGRNTRERDVSVLGHAEMTAIAQACSHIGDWRLAGCTLYVTLEPCPMCAGAILNARVGRVVYGARDGRMGACGSVLDLFAFPLGFEPYVKGGVLGEESAALLTSFFAALREE